MRSQGSCKTSYNHKTALTTIIQSNVSSGKVEKPCLIPISRKNGRKREQDAEKKVGYYRYDTRLTTYTQVNGTELRNVSVDNGEAWEVGKENDKKRKHMARRKGKGERNMESVADQFPSSPSHRFLQCDIDSPHIAR